MAQTLDRTKQQAVYIAVGNFKDDQAPKFLRAPFDVVTISGKIYLQPDGSGLAGQAASQTESVDLEQKRMARQIWYTDLTPLVVEEHEMGCRDEANSWKSMHKFGWL